MKAKVGRGDGFRGVLDYALGKQKRPEVIGGTIAGLNARELAAEFGMVRKLRPDAKRPVWHCSLSLPPGDHLTGEKWDAVVSDFMKEMGFSESTPYIAVRHRDTDKDHVHIVASRINLSGELWHGKWEARRAIEATQKLEKEHGLTLTAGLDDAKKDRKQLKKGEIEMGLRTGEQPPKLKLQNIIDEALKAGDLTAVQFAETLELSGVQVRANLASTGRFNGFSYEVDGVAFKGSSLGKSYSWGQLQKRGVSYEQARDSEELARFSAARVSESNQRAISEGGADRPDFRDVREHQQSATPEPTSVSGRVRQSNDNSNTASITDTQQQNRVAGQVIEPSSNVSRIYGKSSEAYTSSSLENSRVSGGSEASAVAKVNRVSSSNSTASKQSNNSWNARFKAASARKRDSATAASGQSNTARDRVNQADIQQARQIDPTRFFEQMGYRVKRDGQRHFSIRHGKDEAYRLTCKRDGTWLWLDNRGNAGGDNIDLVRELTGLDQFVDCVYELVSKSSSDFDKVAPPLTPQPPRIPPESSQGKMLGRMYLEERGISLETTEHAERSGFLRYLNDGLLFVGYQAGRILNATKRAFSLDAEVQKRDLAGSDKQYPPILSGNSETLWIVEGGIDALAVQDIAKMQGKTPPTVIVSGGSGVKSFLENPEIMEKISAARLVVVAGENEKNADVQAKTDAQHEAQLELVKVLNPSAKALIWKPESRLGSDIADYNLSIKSKREQQESVSLTSNVKASSRDM